jgi:hypothetical protein
MVRLKNFEVGRQLKFKSGKHSKPLMDGGSPYPVRGTPRQSWAGGDCAVCKKMPLPGFFVEKISARFYRIKTAPLKKILKF